MILTQEYHITETQDSKNYFLSLGSDCMIYRANWFLESLRDCILPYGAWKSHLVMSNDKFNEKLKEIDIFDDFVKSIQRYTCMRNLDINPIGLRNPLKNWFIAEKIVDNVGVYLICVAMFNYVYDTRIFKPAYVIDIRDGYVFSKVEECPEQCDYTYCGINFYSLKPFFEKKIIDKVIKDKLMELLNDNCDEIPSIDDQMFWSDKFKIITKSL